MNVYHREDTIEVELNLESSVQNINDDPIGKARNYWNNEEDQTLTIDTSKINDQDGLEALATNGSRMDKLLVELPMTALLLPKMK